MPCRVDEPVRNTDAELRSQRISIHRKINNKRYREATSLRKWLSEELDRPELMRLKANPAIPSGNGDANEHKAERAEVRLCNAIREKIGVAEFEAHMASYPMTNRKAVQLMMWWNDHKAADEARRDRENREREERIRLRRERRLARLEEARAEIARLESEVAELEAAAD